MSRQRIAASRALEILQNLSSNRSDNDGSDSEIDPVVNAALTVKSASVPAVEFDESDSNDEADDEVTHSVVQGGPGLIPDRGGSKWRKIAVSSAAQGRLQSRNIL